MDKTYLPDLISELEQELLRLGYTKGSMTFYRRRWNQLMAYAEDRGECYYTEQLGMDFLKEFFGVTQEDFSRTLPQAETQEIRVIRMVGDFQLHHAVLRRYLKHKEILTTPFFVDIRSRFQSSCEKKGYSQVTTEHYVKQSSYLMDYLAAQGMNDFTAVTLDTVNAYIRTLAGFSYKTVEQHICSLRAFFRFLYQEGIMPDDLAAKMPMVKARKQTAIPSVWTHEELKQLVGAIDRGSPKGRRDYAIILIACRLGLRCTDIKNLCFENFNWTEKKICFTQSKTGQPMELLLVPDVGWAVIDYLRYGRPKVDSSRIFVRHMAPFLPFAEGDHLDQLIRTYMVKAHIPMRGKHRGMHSLRHTMASVLLEKDTPLPVISDIIGHLDTNSTAVYLKVDMERLAECPLDFEEVIRLG
ncbi:site-specific integrase [uncultured Faecalibaculum sp.]|uniref:site-specific integrase n=1 Tax=uncultured Faecalibaculum sp. TaxID=1729681 RepID=UPI00272ED6D9|nr:site-specific integrase [uncultured Faecalibaculum sp.]